MKTAQIFRLRRFCHRRCLRRANPYLLRSTSCLGTFWEPDPTMAIGSETRRATQPRTQQSSHVQRRRLGSDQPESKLQFLFNAKEMALLALYATLYTYENLPHTGAGLMRAPRPKVACVSFTEQTNKQTNKRTARRHVRTHGTKHANRTKDDTRTRGHGPTDGRTRVKSSQTTRSTSGAPHTSATPNLRRVPPAIDIPLNSAINHRRIRHHSRHDDVLHL